MPLLIFAKNKTALLVVMILGTASIAAVLASIMWAQGSRGKNSTQQAALGDLGTKSNDPNIQSSATENNAPFSMEPTLYPTEMKVPSWYPSSNPTETIDPSYMPSTRAPSLLPTIFPSFSPSYNPSYSPSVVPSNDLSHEPSHTPTQSPTNSITESPSKVSLDQPFTYPTKLPSSSHPSHNRMPTTSPSFLPSRFPNKVATTTTPSSQQPSSSSSQSPTKQPLTYIPGDLTKTENNLLLSTGLTSRIIARKGHPVQYHDGSQSKQVFHSLPDAGAVFPHPDKNNKGWIYVSNSEKNNGNGGVGAIRFNANGEVLNYRKVLTGTTMNCGGGVSPWNTWISCEENDNDGQIWEVDPMGKRKPKMTKLGDIGGNYESFAFDHRNASLPRYFYTEDEIDGAIRRYTPHFSTVENVASIGDDDDKDEDKNAGAFHMLHQDGGEISYLVLHPNATNPNRGSFTWTNERIIGEISAEEHFSNCEGIDVRDGILYFVSKRQKEMFILDLDKEGIMMEDGYTKHSTKNGTFDGQPDQIVHLLKESERRRRRLFDGGIADEDENDVCNAIGDIPILYFTEDGGERAGIHGRDCEGNYLTIVEGVNGLSDETTGLAFSRDLIHMYFAHQKDGILFDVWREDGRPFSGESLNVKYHSVNGDIQ